MLRSAPYPRRPRRSARAPNPPARSWCLTERDPRRNLHGAPRRPLPRGAGRAGRRVLHSGRVEGRAPAALIVLSELEILAPAVHADGNVADAGPGVEPGAQRPERAVVRGHRASREPNGRPEEPTALVEHAYSMIRSARPSTDCGIVSPSALAVFILITSSNFVGCSIGRSAGFAPLRILST